MRERDSYMKTGWYDQVEKSERVDYRKGFYQRDFVTRLGTIRPRIARTRNQNFLPRGLDKFQRRAEDIASCSGSFSARYFNPPTGTDRDHVHGSERPNGSKLVTELDQAVEQLHTAELRDEWAYLFLDGVSLRMRRPSGRKRMPMLVAHTVRLDGTRHLLALQRSSGEGQNAGKGSCRICTAAVCKAIVCNSW